MQERPLQSPSPESRAKKSPRNLFRGLLKIETLLSVSVTLGILAVWYLVSEFKLVTSILVPPPQKVLATFLSILEHGYKENSFLRHLGDSMFRLLGSFFLVLFTAIPLGLLSGHNSRVAALLDPLVEFYRPLPPLAYYTLLVLWMGIDNSSKLALLYLAGFAPVYLACAAGVKKIKPDLLSCASTLGADRRQVFWHVVFPACLPDIFTGVRTALGVAYTTLVAAEMVAAVSGIGWMVLDASKFLRSDVIFVGIFVMGVTGILLDQLVRLLEVRLVPWKGKNR